MNCECLIGVLNEVTKTMYGDARPLVLEENASIIEFNGGMYFNYCPICGKQFKTVSQQREALK